MSEFLQDNTAQCLMFSSVRSFQKLEKEAYDLMEVATTGKFLDPAQNPTHILIAMKRVGFLFFKSLVIVAHALA